MNPFCRKYILFYRKLISAVLVVTFGLSMVVSPSGAQLLPNLPAPGQMIWLTSGFQPPVLRGMTVHPENPFLFDFIVSRGDVRISQDDLKKQSTKLVKYFLTALTVPDDESWVNLSPYEKDRIIPASLGQTEMGQQMLEQDYILKQLSSSLTNPDKELGQKFWDEVKRRSEKQFGTTHIPMSTFNKVWIVPDGAHVVEKDGFAYIMQSRLRVMLDEDYQALASQQADGQMASRGALSTPLDIAFSVAGAPATAQQNNQLSSQVFREIILPQLEKEVNEGKNFASTRQVYQSVILAAWYKQTLKESLLGKLYIDKAKMEGVNTADKDFKEKIYAQYLEAFKKGVYNIIKEEPASGTEELIPRKYFSGGEFMKAKITVGRGRLEVSRAAQRMKEDVGRGDNSKLEVKLAETAQEAVMASSTIIETTTVGNDSISRILALPQAEQRMKAYMRLKMALREMDYDHWDTVDVDHLLQNDNFNETLESIILLAAEMAKQKNFFGPTFSPRNLVTGYNNIIDYLIEHENPEGLADVYRDFVSETYKVGNLRLVAALASFLIVNHNSPQAKEVISTATQNVAAKGSFLDLIRLIENLPSGGNVYAYLGQDRANMAKINAFLDLLENQNPANRQEMLLHIVPFASYQNFDDTLNKLSIVIKAINRKFGKNASAPHYALVLGLSTVSNPLSVLDLLAQPGIAEQSAELAERISERGTPHYNYHLLVVRALDRNSAAGANLIETLISLNEAWYSKWGMQKKHYVLNKILTLQEPLTAALQILNELRQADTPLTLESIAATLSDLPVANPPAPAKANPQKELVRSAAKEVPQSLGQDIINALMEANVSPDKIFAIAQELYTKKTTLQTTISKHIRSKSAIHLLQTRYEHASFTPFVLAMLFTEDIETVINQWDYFSRYAHVNTGLVNTIAGSSNPTALLDLLALFQSILLQGEGSYADNFSKLVKNFAASENLPQKVTEYKKLLLLLNPINFRNFSVFQFMMDLTEPPRQSRVNIYSVLVESLFIAKEYLPDDVQPPVLRKLSIAIINKFAAMPDKNRQKLAKQFLTAIDNLPLVLNAIVQSNIPLDKIEELRKALPFNNALTRVIRMLGEKSTELGGYSDVVKFIQVDGMFENFWKIVMEVVKSKGRQAPQEIFILLDILRDHMKNKSLQGWGTREWQLFHDDILAYYRSGIPTLTPVFFKYFRKYQDDPQKISALVRDIDDQFPQTVAWGQFKGFTADFKKKYGLSTIDELALVGRFIPIANLSGIDYQDVYEAIKKELENKGDGQYAAEIDDSLRQLFLLNATDGAQVVYSENAQKKEEMTQRLIQLSGEIPLTDFTHETLLQYVLGLLIRASGVQTKLYSTKPEEGSNEREFFAVWESLLTDTYTDHEQRLLAEITTTAAALTDKQLDDLLARVNFKDPRDVAKLVTASGSRYW